MTTSSCVQLLPLRRADELDLEAAAVGGLAVGTAGIVKVEDNFAREADHRLAHVLHLKTPWRLDDNLVRRLGDDRTAAASVNSRRPCSPFMPTG